MMLKILFGTAALLLLLYNVYVQERKIIALKRENERILNDAVVINKKYLDLKETVDEAEDAIDKATNVIKEQGLRLEKYKRHCFEYGCHTLIS